MKLESICTNGFLLSKISVSQIQTTVVHKLTQILYVLNKRIIIHILHTYFTIITALQVPLLGSSLYMDRDHPGLGYSLKLAKFGLESYSLIAVSHDATAGTHRAGYYIFAATRYYLQKIPAQQHRVAWSRCICLKVRGVVHCCRGVVRNSSNVPSKHGDAHDIMPLAVTHLELTVPVPSRLKDFLLYNFS